MISIQGTLRDEWAYLTNTGNNPDSGCPGLITLYEEGDLRAMTEFGRIVANRIGKFGKAIGDPAEARR